VLVNDTSGSTTWGSGIEQLVQGFYKLNLRPYLERIEASILENLMTTEERIGAHVEFDFDALLRADRRARAEANQKYITAGIRTPNEVRQEEGLPPMAGGDQLYVNGTMVPLTQAQGRIQATGGNNAA
jgi:HK97 family phage portal protein